MKSSIPEIWTIPEAAEKIKGLTPYRLREMCKNGEIPCVKAGRKFLISSTALLRYLNGESFFGAHQQSSESEGYANIRPIKL